MKYEAFISYRHLEKDMYAAKKIHKGLETAKIPKRLQKELGRKKIGRVFRDQEEFPVVTDLGANIEAALSVSNYFIVICSPATKESKWVMKEIDTFIAMHGREKILAVLVDGEPWEAFPPQLLIDENGNDVEPLAADVRGETKKEIDKKLKNELLRIEASILGVDFDDLKQRQRERRIKRNMSIAVGAAAIGVIFGSFSAYNLARINDEYQQKLINESKVLAAKSDDVLSTGDRKAATLIAMEGMPEAGERPLVPESLYALSNALGVYDKSTMLTSDTVIHADFTVKKISTTNDSDVIAFLDSGGNVYVWNLHSGEMVYEIKDEYVDGKPKDVFELSISDDGSIVTVVSEDSVRGYDESGNMIYEYQPDYPIISADISEYKNCMVVEYSESGSEYYPDTIAVLSPETGKELAVYHNDSEAPYSNIVTYDTTGAIVMVGHMPMDDVDNYVSVYCPSNEDNYRKLLVKNDSTISMGIAFTDSYGLVITSAPYEKAYEGGVLTADVQYYDLESGTQTWTNQITHYQKDAYLDSYQVGPCDDGHSRNFNLSAISAGRAVYIVDNRTGEILDQINSDSHISQMITGGENIVLVTDTGYFRVYDYTMGLMNPYYEQRVSDEIYQFGMTKTRMVMIEESGPDIRVCYSDDMHPYDKQITIQGTSKDGLCSPDGEHYVIVSVDNNSPDENIFTIFETENHTEVGKFTTSNPLYSGIRFVDNDTIFVPTESGEFVFYSIEDDEKQVVNIENSSYEMGYSASYNDKYVVAFSYTFADVYDLSSREKIYHQEFSYLVKSCLVSSGGDCLYLLDKDNCIHVVDLEQEKDKNLEIKYGVLSMTISPDDSYLALNCDDNQLRIINISDGKEIASFSYVANQDGYMNFSEDGKYLYTQASNKFFRIYDISKEKMILVSDEIDSSIRRTDYDEESGILAISTLSDMYLIDANSVGLLAYVDIGRMFIPETGLIISGNGSEILIYHYRDAEELVKEAQRRYGDEELSDEQKLLYGIGLE